MTDLLHLLAWAWRAVPAGPDLLLLAVLLPMIDRPALTAQDLAFELCRPAALVQAAVDQLVSDGHLRPAKKDGRKQTPYILCRTH